MKKLLLLIAALFLVSPLGYAQGTPSVTNQVTLTVGAEAALTIGASATVLTLSGANFANYTGTTAFTYFIRTTNPGGSGAINLQVTSDFSPAGGPSVLSPPTVSDTLSYTCTVSAPGTACTGSQTSLTTATTPVATFGVNAHSIRAGNSASVSWVLPNDPLYATGTFTAVVTYTISAS